MSDSKDKVKDKDSESELDYSTEPESAFTPPESENPWEDYQDKHSRPARRGVKKFRERNCC